MESQEQGNEHSIARYSAEDQRALENHYESFFGQKCDKIIHEIYSHKVHLDIYIFGSSPSRPYVTLATSGMGAATIQDAAGHIMYPAELVTYVPTDWDFASREAAWLNLRILELARYPHLYNKALAKNHTLCVYDEKTNLADAIFPGAQLTHWYMRSLMYEPAEIDHLVLPSGKHLNFLWPFPITRHEFRFAFDSDDPSELEVQLVTHELVSIDIHRKCLIAKEGRQERRAREREQKRMMRSVPKQSWKTITCQWHDAIQGAAGNE